MFKKKSLKLTKNSTDLNYYFFLVYHFKHLSLRQSIQDSALYKQIYSRPPFGS